MPQSRRRIPRGECVTGTLGQLEVYLAARLAIKFDEALELWSWMYDVARVLDVEHGRQFDRFAALQRLDRISFGHRVFGLPILVMERQHQIDEFRIGFAALF